ncbi:hypothetical protein OGA58_004477 [Salmonella enterica]|nr:hypothetical protein [Salmonella enterica]
MSIRLTLSTFARLSGVHQRPYQAPLLVSDYLTPFVGFLFVVALANGWHNQQTLIGLVMYQAAKQRYTFFLPVITDEKEHNR